MSVVHIRAFFHRVQKARGHVVSQHQQRLPIGQDPTTCESTIRQLRSTSRGSIKGML